MTAPTLLRAATPGDSDFFRQLYATTRMEELARVAWPPAVLRAFCDQQFAAQTAHYRTHYVGASVHVVVVGGRDAGRLYVHRTGHELRIVDLSLLPDARGRGTGSSLLRELLDEAASERKTLSLHVEKGNRARRLYERLGFVEVADVGLHVLMVCAPGSRAVAS